MTDKRPSNPIVEFFKKYHGYEPSKELSELDVAKKIIEVFGNRTSIALETEKECEHYMRYEMPCKKNERIKIILDMEDFQGINALSTR